MNPIPVDIATEDELSEVVLKQVLLNQVERQYSIGTAYRRGGYGYLKKNIQGWNRAAASRPFVVLTDLDEAPCASSLIRSWLNVAPHPNLIFRIAVREVESWLLADANGLAGYLGVRANSLPEYPDELDDPKAALVALARASRLSEIKSRVVPKLRSTAKQGPDYNACLSAFVLRKWNVEIAANRSPSLRRTIERLKTFIPTWP